jgi:hypothetical protein
MDVAAVEPLQAGSLVWSPGPGLASLTVVCKATYLLAPGESLLAPDQEPVHAEDQPWGPDAPGSLRAPGDLAPRKARADVTLVGLAFAPRGEPVRSLVARLVVGPVDKEIEVCGDRFWTRDGVLREEARFASMPLVLERAAGGPGTDNPAGVRTGPALADARGAVELPNLQPAGGAPEARADLVDPVLVGPLPASYPARRARLGPHAVAWADRGAVDAPMPEDMDFAYFNAAPPDQQIPLLRDGERLILQNLHRDHPRLITSLPASRPRAFAERPGTAPREVALRCDALWIDTDRGICTLTWRGQLPLADPQEPGRVLAALEPQGQRLTYEDVLAQVGPPDPPTLPPAVIAPPEDETRPGRSFSPPPSPAFETTTARVPIYQPPGPVLPFARDPGAPALPQPPDPIPPRPRTDTVLVSHASQSPATGPGWLRKTGDALPAPPAPPPPLPAPPPPLPVSIAVPPAPRFGVPPAADERPSAPPPLRTPPPLVARPPAVPPRNMVTLIEPPAGEPPRPVTPWSAEAPAAREAPTARDVHAAREAIVLLWIDPAAAPRLHAAFPDLLATSPAPLEGDRLDAAALRVLTSAKRSDAAAVEDAVTDALGPDARLRPPLVVVAGDLRFPFDELSALRATMGTALPFAAGDAPLREALDAAAAALASPSSTPPDALAERLSRRIAEVFSQGARALPPGFFAAQIERALLQRRAYQRRALLGGDPLRALVALAGGEGAFPVYLPEGLTKVLPMFPAIDARILAEAHPPQDQGETAPAALKVLALGRVLPAGRRRGR